MKYYYDLYNRLDTHAIYLYIIKMINYDVFQAEITVYYYIRNSWICNVFVGLREKKVFIIKDSENRLLCILQFGHEKRARSCFCMFSDKCPNKFKWLSGLTKPCITFDIRFRFRGVFLHKYIKFQIPRYSHNYDFSRGLQKVKFDDF